MTSVPCQALWPHCTRGSVEVSPHQDGYVHLSVSAGPGNYAHVLVKVKDWEKLMEQPYDSTQDTKDHISRVRSLLIECRNRLADRGYNHDRSKLESPEKEAFDVLTPRLKGLAYGSDEYRESLRELKPALDHHYAANSHHPEHWENGVNDMSLLDVIEMLMDWKAASERHESGDIWTSIAHNQKRFGLSDQLTEILCNTAHEMGW